MLLVLAQNFSYKFYRLGNHASHFQILSPTVFHFCSTSLRYILINDIACKVQHMPKNKNKSFLLLVKVKLSYHCFENLNLYLPPINGGNNAHNKFLQACRTFEELPYHRLFLDCLILCRDSDLK